MCDLKYRVGGQTLGEVRSATFEEVIRQVRIYDTDGNGQMTETKHARTTLLLTSF